VGLTEELVRLGFETDRLKTGTPARVDSRTVDFTNLEAQPGEGGGVAQPHAWQVLCAARDWDLQEVLPCHARRKQRWVSGVYANAQLDH